MPGAYPAPPPTLSGDLETISRFLQSPTQIRRRLRDFRDLRFVSDQILTQRFRASGGAVVYEQSEPFTMPRPARAVAAGSLYPASIALTGTAGLAAVSKWGLKSRLTDEEITRNVFAGAAVDRVLRKVINSIISQVDATALAAVASAVTQTQAVTNGAWSVTATSTPFLDIQLAVAQILALNLGYKPDTILLGDTKYAYLSANTVVSNLLRREDTNNPVYTGTIDTIAGLTIVRSPNLPTTDVWIIDSTQLGGMADETADAPGYAVADMGIGIKSIRQEELDAWDVQGRRLTVPVVQEPGAGIRITGT